MNKLSKTAKIIKKTLSILYKCSILFVCLILISILIFSLSNQSQLLDQHKIFMGPYKMIINNWVSIDQTKPIFIIGLINAILYTLYLGCIIKILNNLFTPMADGKPFTESAGNTLKKISFIELIFGLALSIDRYISSKIIYSCYNYSELFTTENLTINGVHFEMNWNYILLSVILLLLSFVFEYGEDLQKLSDETL